MILVAGGTGRLGSRVTAGLLDAGLPVRVLSRGVTTGEATGGAEVAIGDVCDAAACRRALTGVDTIVSAFTGFPFRSPRRVDRDGNATLTRAAEEVGATVVLISLTGVADDHDASLFAAKRAAEARLRASTVPWTILRPDACAETWIDIIEQTGRPKGRPLVFGDGSNPLGWLSVRDTAALVVHAVGESGLRGETLTLTGPELLTLEELAEGVMRRQGWTGAPRRIPRAGLHAMAVTAGSFVPRLRRQAQMSLVMDRLDPVVDTARERVPGLPSTPVSELLGVKG